MIHVNNSYVLLQQKGKEEWLKRIKIRMQNRQLYWAPDIYTFGMTLAYIFKMPLFFKKDRVFFAKQLFWIWLVNKINSIAELCM